LTNQLQTGISAFYLGMINYSVSAQAVL